MKIAMFVIAALIILGCAYRGTKRGAFKTIVSIGIIAASLAAAILISKPAAEKVYSEHIQQPVIDETAQALDEYDITGTIKKNIKDTYDIEISQQDLDRISKCGDVASEIKSIASEKGENISLDEVNEKLDSIVDADTIHEMAGDNISEDTAKTIADAIAKEGQSVREVIKAACTGDNKATAMSLEENIFRSKITGLVRIILAIAIFVVVLIALKIIFAVLSIAKMLPVAKQLTKGAGFALGFAEGVMIVAALYCLLTLGGDNSLALLSITALK